MRVADEFAQGMGISNTGRWHQLVGETDLMTQSARALCGRWCYVSTNVDAYTPELRPVASGDRWAPKCATCDRIHNASEGK